MKVKIYVKRTQIERTVLHGRMTYGAGYSPGGMWAMRHIADKSASLQVDCGNTIDIVKDFALNHGLKVKIYDLSSWWGMTQARREGVKGAPAVVLGGRKIEGVPSQKALEDALA
ncbi:MAG: hypothetical protein AB1665_06195, partial [Candidatus Thermoplasmatota archaeon]